MRTVTREEALSVAGPPVSKNYRPSVGGMPAWAGAGMRVFSLDVVDAMMGDEDVAMGTEMIYTPVIRQENQWQVLADSPEIKAFVEQTYARFWQTSIRSALDCVRFGYFGGEYLYKFGDDRRLAFDKVKPFHARDVASGRDPRTGELGGLFLTGDGANGELRLHDGPKPAKACWLYYGSEFNNWYGRSRYNSAYGHWSDKNGIDGTKDIIRMWYYKNAYSGLVIRHPDKNILLSTGYVAARDMAMQIAEVLKTGGVAAVPSTVDPRTGKDEWSIEWPHMNGNAEGLLEYLQTHTTGIFRGLYIPDDVVGGSGGMAGKKVSEDAFYTMEEDVFHSIATPFDEQVVKPLVWFNFGPGEKYKIIHAPMLPARQQLDAVQQSGAAAKGGGNPDAGENPLSALVQSQAGGGQPQQPEPVSLSMVRLAQGEPPTPPDEFKEKSFFDKPEPPRAGLTHIGVGKDANGNMTHLFADHKTNEIFRHAPNSPGMVESHEAPKSEADFSKYVQESQSRWEKMQAGKAREDAMRAKAAKRAGGKPKAPAAKPAEPAKTADSAPPPSPPAPPAPPSPGSDGDRAANDRMFEAHDKMRHNVLRQRFDELMRKQVGDPGAGVEGQELSPEESEFLDAHYDKFGDANLDKGNLTKGSPLTKIDKKPFGRATALDPVQATADHLEAAAASNEEGATAKGEAGLAEAKKSLPPKQQHVLETASDAAQAKTSPPAGAREGLDEAVKALATAHATQLQKEAVATQLQKGSAPTQVGRQDKKTSVNPPGKTTGVASGGADAKKTIVPQQPAAPASAPVPLGDPSQSAPTVLAPPTPVPPNVVQTPPPVTTGGVPPQTPPVQAPVAPPPAGDPAQTAPTVLAPNATEKPKVPSDVLKGVMGEGDVYQGAATGKDGLIKHHVRGADGSLRTYDHTGKLVEIRPPATTVQPTPAPVPPPPPSPQTTFDPKIAPKTGLKTQVAPPAVPRTRVSPNTQVDTKNPQTLPRTREDKQKIHDDLTAKLIGGREQLTDQEHADLLDAIGAPPKMRVEAVRGIGPDRIFTLSDAHGMRYTFSPKDPSYMRNVESGKPVSAADFADGVHGGKAVAKAKSGQPMTGDDRLAVASAFHFRDGVEFHSMARSADGKPVFIFKDAGGKTFAVWHGGKITDTADPSRVFTHKDFEDGVLVRDRLEEVSEPGKDRLAKYYNENVGVEHGDRQVKSNRGQYRQNQVHLGKAPGEDEHVKKVGGDPAQARKQYRETYWANREHQRSGLDHALLRERHRLEYKHFHGGGLTPKEESRLADLHEMTEAHAEALKGARDVEKKLGLTPQDKAQARDLATKTTADLKSKGMSGGQIFAMAAIAMIVLPMLLRRRGGGGISGLLMAGLAMMYMQGLAQKSGAAAPQEGDEKIPEMIDWLDDAGGGPGPAPPSGGSPPPANPPVNPPTPKTTVDAKLSTVVKAAADAANVPPPNLDGLDDASGAWADYFKDVNTDAATAEASVGEAGKTTPRTTTTTGLFKDVNTDAATKEASVGEAGNPAATSAKTPPPPGAKPKSDWADVLAKSGLTPDKASDATFGDGRRVFANADGGKYHYDKDGNFLTYWDRERGEVQPPSPPPNPKTGAKAGNPNPVDTAKPRVGPAPATKLVASGRPKPTALRGDSRPTIVPNRRKETDLANRDKKTDIGADPGLGEPQAKVQKIGNQHGVFGPGGLGLGSYDTAQEAAEAAEAWQERISSLREAVQAKDAAAFAGAERSVAAAMVADGEMSQEELSALESSGYSGGAGAKKLRAKIKLLLASGG